MSDAKATPRDKAKNGFLTYAVLREINPSLPPRPSEDYLQSASAKLAKEAGSSISGEELQTPILISGRTGEIPEG